VTDGVIDDPPNAASIHRPSLQRSRLGGLPDRKSNRSAEENLCRARTSTGEQIIPGFVPGGRNGSGRLARMDHRSRIKQRAAILFRDADFREYESTTIRPGTSRPSTSTKTGKLSDEKLASSLNATDPNLKAFKARGGKLICITAWSDAALPPVNTINYFQSVVSKMGQRDAGSFIRLFMVPGMQHCGGGPGPNSFGAVVTSGQADAQHDMSIALERWVEEGAPPDQIVASKRQGIDPKSPITRTASVSVSAGGAIQRKRQHG